MPFIRERNTVQRATEKDTHSMLRANQSVKMEKQKKALREQQNSAGINEIDTYTHQQYKTRKTLQYP